VPGQNILMAAPDDAPAWLSHLESLDTSGPARKALTDSALELVRTGYDWEILGQKLCATYEGWLRDGA
jgi:hypothetical protein